MAKYCSNCGNKVDENAYICLKCGVVVNNNMYNQNRLVLNRMVGVFNVSKF